MYLYFILRCQQSTSFRRDTTRKARARALRDTTTRDKVQSARAIFNFVLFLVGRALKQRQRQRRRSRTSASRCATKTHTHTHSRRARARARTCGKRCDVKCTSESVRATAHFAFHQKNMYGKLNYILALAQTTLRRVFHWNQHEHEKRCRRLR